MKLRNRAPAGNLDSLLDTMTNVVGIMLILLAVTQLGVGDAVKRIHGKESVKSDSEYQSTIVQSQQFARALDQEKSKLQQLNAGLPEKQLGLAKKQNEIVAAKLQLAELDRVQADVDRVFKETQAQRQQVRDLEAQLAQTEQQMARLKAQLNASPAPAPPPEPKVVNLPNPRAAPKGSHPVEFICQHGRVVPFNPAALRRIAQVRIDRSEQDLRIGDRIDCPKLSALFEEEDIGNSYFRLKIKTVNGVPRLLLNHRENAGDTADELGDRKSMFQQVLNNVDKKTEYLRFHVYPDSYGTYLAAREVASRPYNLNAGWDPVYSGHVHDVDLGFKTTVYCSDFTPPAPPPVVPSPPKTPKQAPSVSKPKIKIPTPTPTIAEKAPPPPLPNDDID